MSSVEVSIIASNHKLESDAEPYQPRRQRPPPPPPNQVQIRASGNEQTTVIPPKSETTRSVAETTSESVDNLNNISSSLLTEFKRLFNNFDYELIREDILNRKMIECNFITILWRIFLHCLPRDSTQWGEMLDTSRNTYEKLVDQYTINPYKVTDDNDDGTLLNHPLSRDEDSLWWQYFKDQELKGTITKDVLRTCPDITYFRNQRIIDLQLRILFTHTRHHYDTTPYRQGMHEILGIIIYSLHTESLKVNEYEESNELMKKIYDAEYLEHDAYAIFEKIMDHLRQFYALTNNTVIRKSPTIHDNKQIPFQKLNDVHTPANDTAIQMNALFERLQHCDPLLYRKLEELQIEPTVFGVRWLRVLFGREIPFESIPNLWTVIFCYDEHFGFVDYFFIALLMEVGRIIGKQGNITPSHFLQALMRQNIVTNVEPAIRKALSLAGRQVPPLPEEPIIPFKTITDEPQKNPIDDEPEHKPQAKIRRIPLIRASESHLNRSLPPESRKALSPSQTNPSIHEKHTIKHSSSSNNLLASSSSPMKKPIPSNAWIDAELDLWSGKTTRQQYEENTKLQKECANYMNKFIDRLQTQICELNAPNEDELHIHLSGLKQIASVLDGKLTYDDRALQTLLDYKSKDKPVEANKSDKDELA